MRALRKRYGRSRPRSNPVECQHADTCRARRNIDLPAMKRAKQKYYGSEGGATIYLVDGGFVRSNLDNDFTLGSHGHHSVFIPEGEIWVESGLHGDDLKAVIAHEVAEYRHMTRGMSYARAHEKANAVERRMRKGAK